jgi:hypothetical protein
MTDSPTTNYGLRQQELGTNNNTWGDTKLNAVLQVIDQVFGTIKTIAITGDYTITSTNYVTTADNKNAGFKFTGTLTANATITLPTVSAFFKISNATTGGYSLLAKTAAGATVTIPAGSIAYVFTDGVDALTGAPSYFGQRLQGVLTGTAATDAVNKTQMETAIAAASGLTAPFILVSLNDTTPGYLRQKLTIQVTGATTTQISGLQTVQFATINGSANEQVALQITTPYVGGYIPDGVKTSQYTPVVGHSAIIDTSSASFTINLTGMTTPQTEQSFKLTSVYNGIDPYFLGTLNGVSNSTASLSGSREFVYVGGTTGWSGTASTTMGVNFTDPYKFIPVSAIANSLKTWTSLTVTSGNNELVGDTSATFQQTIGGVGATLTQTFTANTYNTILNVTATKAGEVTTIYGPIQNTTGAQIIRITRDGGTPKTLTISVTAGYRACLLTGGIQSSATTPANLATAQFGANTARNTLDLSSAASSPKLLTDFQTAKYYGTSLFEFSRSLLVEIQSTSTIASTGLFESTAGVVYRTLLAG